MQETDYKIKLPTFEGPFDLLFHLIRKAEVDIWSISIADITAQYLAYLQSMKELNLDIASEFLVMAATLLRLKSKLLLPRPGRNEGEAEEEELFEINTAEELFQRLEEYRFFKEIAEDLRKKEEEQQKIYLRSTGGQKVMVFTQQDSVYTIWEGAHHLSDIMLQFLEATKSDAYITTFAAVEDLILIDKSVYILDKLSSVTQPLLMKDLITNDSLWETIITFIALLELARQQKVILMQERLFGPIYASIFKGTDSEEAASGESSANANS